MSLLLWASPTRLRRAPCSLFLGEKKPQRELMTFYIKVKDHRLADIKFKTFGCGAAIAVSSMVSEMAMGKTIEEVRQITPDLVAKELEGLPKNKFHCSNLGAQALNKAVDDYVAKEGKATKPKP